MWYSVSSLEEFRKKCLSEVVPTFWLHLHDDMVRHVPTVSQGLLVAGQTVGLLTSPVPHTD